MYCPSCGTEAAVSARFCARCGGVLPDATVPRGAAPGSPGRAGVAAYAGFWRRTGAAVVDLLLFALIAVAIYLVGGDDAKFTARLALFTLWSIGFPLLEASAWQGSPGKRLFGIKVTDADGERPGFVRALGRTLAKLLSLLVLAPLGFLMSGFTVRKQCLHDLVAGCLVLKRSVTAEELAGAAPRRRGAGWWVGMVASILAGLPISLFVASQILLGDDSLFAAVISERNDEPLLEGRGERPIE